MTNEERDAAAVRIPPPLVFLGGVVAGALLHAFARPVPLSLSPWLRTGIAVVVGACGLWLLVGALRSFARTGQDPEPWKPTPEIVSQGVYRVTRNPMYVGLALIQTTLGVALANGWILALVPVSLTVVYLTAVRHEEHYLERKFGDVYLDYKARVRRWI